MWELPNRLSLNLFPFVIAEAGVNHNGDIEIAKKLVDAAVSSGADAVKFQTFKADTLLSKSSPKAEYQLQTTDSKESQYDMLKKLELSEEEFKEIYRYCKEKDILFISTPFDKKSADFLEQLGVDIYKVASSEITNLPLLKHIASKQKSVILSTGMSTLSEVAAAVEEIEKINQDLTILHCVSNYPASHEDLNLSCLATLSSAFPRYPIGYSDHTKGDEAVITAVALGASVIERHFTLDTSMEGPDHRASLNPTELKEMIQSLQKVKRSLGSSQKTRTTSERSSAETMRKSLVAAVDIPAGITVTSDMVSIKRPGTGIKPSMLEFVIGLKPTKFIEQDEVIKEDHFK